MNDKKEVINTRIWLEESAKDNPFAASACFCAGYDVYGDLLGKISWTQYLYLLFKLELPTTKQEKLLETIAVAIANPGIRDHSVRAAMNAGVGGSTRASALIAAISVGAGNLNGGHEIVQMVRWWNKLGTDITAWLESIMHFEVEIQDDVWHPMEHIPGFDPNGVSCTDPVLKTLSKLCEYSIDGSLNWLNENRAQLELKAGYPLSMSGVIATGMYDLGLDEGQSEILFLLLKLPGAAAHALEQEKLGWSRYPFFSESVSYCKEGEYSEIMKKIGDRK